MDNALNPTPTSATSIPDIQASPEKQAQVETEVEIPKENEHSELHSKIASLQKELENAWSLIDLSKTSKLVDEERIRALESQIEAMAVRQETPKPLVLEKVPSPQFEKQEIQEEKPLKIQTPVVPQSPEIQVIKEQVDKKQVDEEKLLMNKEIADLKMLFSHREDEFTAEQNIRQKIERELHSAKQTADSRSTESKQKADALLRANDEMRKLEQQIKDLREIKEKLTEEKNTLFLQKNAIQMELEIHSIQNNKLLTEKEVIEAEAQAAEDESVRIQNELASLRRIKDMLQRKFKVADEQRVTIETQRDGLKSTNYSLQRQLESLKNQAETDQKQIELLLKERDMLSKNALKASSNMQKHANMAKIHEQAKQTLETEILGYKEEAAKQRKLLLALEKERDRYVNETSLLVKSKTDAEEQVLMKENIILDYKKKIIESEHKLHQQQSLYEQVRSDRNVYSKNLIETQDEIIEMRRKIKIMAHQIEQYKEEIAAKESALLKEHFEHQKVDKEKEAVKQELQKVKHQLESAQHFVQNQQAEENKLRHIIAESDQERMRQKKEHEAITQERDILGTQLIRRNDELALLYEKIKIQQSTLNKGEIQYRERLEDIRVLKLEIKRLRREKSILKKESESLERMKSEICSIQRQLMNEKTRVRVLEEELENPLNIHRWRKLGGSDPSTYELVRKIQTLQRRLIRKTEQIVEKELLLHAKEKLYTDLKAMLLRVPGPEVIHKIQTLKNHLKEKTKKLKSLSSELTMHQSLSADYKQEIENLNTIIQKHKKEVLRKRVALPAVPLLK